jgi:hypothetical protein
MVPHVRLGILSYTMLNTQYETRTLVSHGLFFIFTRSLVASALLRITLAMTTNDSSLMVLRRIALRAQRVLCSTSLEQSLSLADRLPQSLCRMDRKLPSAEPITSVLVGRGINASLAEKMSRLYLLDARALKDIYETQMHAALLHWIRTAWSAEQQAAAPTQLAAIYSKYHDHYLELLRSRIELFVAKYQQRLATLQSLKSQQSDDITLEIQGKSLFKTVSLFCEA